MRELRERDTRPMSVNWLKLLNQAVPTAAETDLSPHLSRHDCAAQPTLADYCRSINTLCRSKQLALLYCNRHPAGQVSDEWHTSKAALLKLLVRKFC